MLGASKIGCTQRLNDTGGYTPCLSKIIYRDEIDFVGRTTLQNKDRYLWRKVYTDLYDIKVSDHITFNDGTVWVVTTGLVHNDTLGNHLEIPVRQINSFLHETVIVRRISKTQPNFDVNFQEFINYEQPEGTDYELTVLIDVMDKSKEQFIKFIEPGKLEGIDYVMTVDLPDMLEINDLVFYNGVQYKIDWRVMLPYETLIGISRAIKSYY